MSKWSLKNRLLQVRVSTCVYALLCFMTIYRICSLSGCYNYPHLSPEVIETHLYKQIAPTVKTLKNSECKYDVILKNNITWSPASIPKIYDNFDANGIANGTFLPQHCKPRFSVAILVPYRNRQKQLDVFLPYMHDFLRKQNIHYKIYLLEQQDEKPWNKGILYNIGAKQAIRDKFPCLILHDVDLLPLDASNLYACTDSPRHMSASIDKFRYVLIYDYLVGGVLAITANQFSTVNGFSNMFEGWGGEDDDFANRLSAHKLDVVRFPNVMSRYTMLVHRQEKKNSLRKKIIDENKHSRRNDGLNSLTYQDIITKNHRLFTLIGVKL